MPAGDQIEADHQFELNGVLMGKLTPFTYGGIIGLGPPPPRDQDLELEQGDGELLGRTTRGSRIITLKLKIRRRGETDAWSSFGTLRDAWGDLGETEFHFQLPSWGHRKLVGEPRGFVEEVTKEAVAGSIPVLCTFKALNPTIYSGT